MIRKTEDKMNYLVSCGIYDRSARIGSYWAERDDKDNNLATTVKDLLDGQFDHPLSVVCFNPVEHICDDVSEEIAYAVVAALGQDIMNRQVFEFCEDHLGCQAMVGIPHD